jgi:DNA-directed RNA polymerase specialized sigma subunit
MTNEELFSKSRSEWERLIDDWIFNQRDREILKNRLLDGVTIEKLAEKFDISVSQTKRIINKGVDTISRKVS